MSPAPLGRGRKGRGVRRKKDVYYRVLTKYKRLGPFSNPKSEKGAGDRHLELFVFERSNMIPVNFLLDDSNNGPYGSWYIRQEFDLHGLL